MNFTHYLVTYCDAQWSVLRHVFYGALTHIYIIIDIIHCSTKFCTAIYTYMLNALWSSK